MYPKRLLQLIIDQQLGSLENIDTFIEIYNLQNQDWIMKTKLSEQTNITKGDVTND